MASIPLLSFRPTGTRTFATASGDSRGGTKAARAGSGSWWTPLFGWPSEPDYFEESVAGEAGYPVEKKAEKETQEMRRSGRSIAFTEDKARRLRMMTAETSAFHDIMYHSSIASRLASDFSARSDD